jgi:5-methylcytosine-specific restriction endonuclease McrA
MARNRYYNSAHWKQLRAACLKRDGYRCTVAGCGSRERLVCDHIVTRPNDSRPTQADTLENLRILCGLHDYQVKEKHPGEGPGQPRRAPRTIGCDAAGLPVDPQHPWARS